RVLRRGALWLPTRRGAFLRAADASGPALLRGVRRCRLRRRPGRLRLFRAGQRPPIGLVDPLAIANERLDDLQRRTRLALRAPTFKIGRQFPVRAQDFLPANFLVALRGGTFAWWAHRRTLHRS